MTTVNLTLGVLILLLAPLTIFVGVRTRAARHRLHHPVPVERDTAHRDEEAAKWHAIRRDLGEIRKGAHAREEHLRTVHERLETIRTGRWRQ